MKIYPIAKSTKTPICDEASYEAMYAESMNDSDAFWLILQLDRFSLS